MPILFVLAPKLLVLGPLLLVLCFAARRLAGPGEAALAYRRLGRAAAAMTIVGAVPVMMVIVESGGMPESFAQALAAPTHELMTSQILN
ncbi:hypothetical protein [Frigidibacter sp. ROC022]|uniref:hypothetical protein n=1 Tax=Frigidibacter sp. ROC022 TaxID=2971796 RepID=UPI00215B0D6E|nr:hypothetical protein [Frigidibacter sp. ROC022]MCR8725849.1 hypothetical protein [Frigidibacter sp. ROC022]